MTQLLEMSQKEIEASFAATCVETVARRLNVSYLEVFNRMKAVDMFNALIFPCYDTLHTEDREVIADRLKNMLDDPIKSPIVQEIVLCNLIGMVVGELSNRLKISVCRAFELFYGSKTCAHLHDKSTGLYLFGPLYIADEFILENRYD